VEPSQFGKNTVYASFENHMYGDHRTYAAKSEDMGRTWKLFTSSEFTGFAHKIKEDPVNKNLLFLGTEMGLFSSIDGGENWYRMKNNIPWYALVRDIQIHPRTNDLVLATHGRGIMIVDDITPMRTLNRELLEKDVHFFEVVPMTLTMGRFGDGGFPSTGGYVAPNSASITPIQYYLKDRVSSGNVKLEIYDSNGKMVQSLPGTTRKGVNKITWNQRITPPKTAGGSTKTDFGSFVAPQVLPGDYTLKLKVAGKEYSQPLKMVHDPSSSFTLAERELQHKTAMELYAQHEDLAKTAADISARQKTLKDNMSKVKSEKLKKDMQAYYDKLESLRAELVPTKQTSIFADENRLREDITEVYSAVCNNEQAPTNLQLDRVKELRRKVDEAARKNSEITRQYDEKIRAALTKEGLMPSEKN
jgi:hypothetical protein